ncbi:hypothetical protein DYB37_006349 [Aphanomyces astaci]|uniref:Uncharacterized protein n=2 Tax=Aphanomyces astaci TaxID=112090 RepID=A0A3R7FDV7_APHAT|nr:hypothetical protein DYB35_006860 [Aphanomyces astaci]RHZ31845.1 hypothetical protein DYB37_006349 [Aphanomyces astaci]
MHIPPGARTSESEGPENQVAPIPTDKKFQLEPQHDDDAAHQSDEKDYVDPTLFSAEVSRHSIDIAVRRARNLEQELRDIEKNAPPPLPPPKASYTSMLTTAVSSTLLSAVKRISSSASTTRYSLLDPNASSSEGGGIVGERDVLEGDGMQLSPVSGGSSDNEDLYRRTGPRPALRKISAYEKPISAGMVPTLQSAKKSIVWTRLPHETADDDIDVENALEGHSLIHQDQVKITITSQQQERPKRQQKPGVIRRLSPVEKEALYELRPDLKIVPNWAQKYREEMTGNQDSMQCNNWLVCLILFLMVLLVFLFYMIGVTKPDVR